MQDSLRIRLHRGQPPNELPLTVGDLRSSTTQTCLFQEDIAHFSCIFALISVHILECFLPDKMIINTQSTLNIIKTEIL